MTHRDIPDTTRDARLEARVSAAQKRLLQQAAAISGCTLSEFVVASAQDAARRVIAEHESIRLSRGEQLAFVQALLQPPEPMVKVRLAAKDQESFEQHKPQGFSGLMTSFRKYQDSSRCPC